MDTNKIIEKAKESYDRYFKDAPVFPENHEQDVVCNAEEIEKIIELSKIFQVTTDYLLLDENSEKMN